MPKHKYVSVEKKSNRPAPVAAKQGGKGTKAFSSIAMPATSQTPAQLFPYKRKNTRTNRTFRITHEKGELSAVQIDGDPDDRHSGYLTYKIRGKAIELSHIGSDPEEGSGIGSLLTYFFAEIAEQGGFELIEIYTAAPTAIGFYELMGFKSANEEGTEKFEKALSDDKDEQDKALQNYISLRARIEYDSAPENHTFKRRGFTLKKTQLKFDDLGDKEKEALKKDQLVKFGLKTNEERSAILQKMIHGKAVGMYGMVGKTSTVKSRAKAQSARWIDPEAWTEEQQQQVWDSRLDTTTLTEFPRHPGE